MQGIFSNLFGLAALTLEPAASAPATDACLAGCAGASLSVDDRATCRLLCAPPARPSAVPPAASPPGGVGTPTVRLTPPVTAGPSAMDLHRQALCESPCDEEKIVSDRTTCRLQCAQLSRFPRPVALTAPGTPGVFTTSGTSTYYSFPPGGSRVPTSVGPAPSSTAGSYASAAAQAQQIAACQVSCEHVVSLTDRATCRNNCAAVGTVLGPVAPGTWVLGPAPASSDAEQRAAVIRSSTGVVGGTRAAASPTTISRVPVAAAPAAPAPASPACAAQLQACGNVCASEQSVCVVPCDQGRMSATDRATCKLICEANGDMCSDDCRIKEAACRGPTYR